MNVRVLVLKLPQRVVCKHLGLGLIDARPIEDGLALAVVRTDIVVLLNGFSVQLITTLFKHLKFLIEHLKVTFTSFQRSFESKLVFFHGVFASINGQKFNDHVIFNLAGPFENTFLLQFRLQPLAKTHHLVLHLHQEVYWLEHLL